MFKIVAIFVFAIGGNPDLSATQSYRLGTESFGSFIQCARFVNDHGVRVGMRMRPFGVAIKRDGHVITSTTLTCSGG